MSLSVTLWCDECTKSYSLRHGNINKLRDQAFVTGWTYRDGRDFCPDCTEEEDDE